jgi:hypothetical protein
MKSLCLLVVSVLVGGPVVAAQAPRIRPLDPVASAAYARGNRQSERFRALVAELDASNLIVHIVTTAGLPSGISGTTRLVAHVGGARYVRIELASSLTGKMRVSILAHGCNARASSQSDASTPSAVRTLYRAIGKVADGNGAIRNVGGRAGGPRRLDGTRRRPRPRPHRRTVALWRCAPPGLAGIPAPATWAGRPLAGFAGWSGRDP